MNTDLSTVASTLSALKIWLLSTGMDILIALLILVVGFKLVNFIEKRMMRTRAWIKIDPTLQSFLDAFIRMGLKGLVIVTAVIKAGVPSATFVAIIGAAGLAVGLALQGSLSNLAGGVLIIALHPFKIGDYIEGSGHSGTVDSIGLFYTTLNTPDNKVIVIPNGGLANNSLINYSSRDVRRVDLDFGVSYDANIGEVKAAIKRVIDKNPMIHQEPAPFIRLAEHGGSSLNFKVRLWVNASDYWETYYYMMEEVKEEFDKENIEIPYPHMVVQNFKTLSEGDNPKEV